MASPWRTVISDGTNRHAPTEPVACNSALNDASVVVPRPRHVPAPIPALNVAESQLSWICTALLRNGLLLSLFEQNANASGAVTATSTREYLRMSYGLH